MATKRSKRHYTPPRERGQSSEGGGWSLNQASQWSGIGVISLRKMAKRQQFPCLWVGRRCLVPREAFKQWFNSAGGKTPLNAA
jgi:putative SOS response-associated peptidase YedK